MENNTSNIIIKKEKTRKLLASWLGVEDEEVENYLELIFSKLGVKNEDDILTFEFNQQNDLVFKVNDDKSYSMHIRYDDEDRYPVIYFNKDNSEIEFGYQCIFKEVNKNLTLSLNLFKFDVVTNHSILSYELSNEWIEYGAKTGDYLFEFRFSKPNKFISKNGYFVKYEMPNHKKLINYLASLDFSSSSSNEYNLSIFDIYQKILEISLDDSMDKYDLIDLRVMKWIPDEFSGNYDIIEHLHLINGRLVTLTTTRNGKQILMDQTGSWHCDTDGSMVEFYACRTPKMITFTSRVMPKEDSENYTSSVAYADMNYAKKEVSNVKKLLREMIPQTNKKDSN